MTAYDESNIFAKIVRGELPCHKIHEDEQVLAFMDIMPRTRGHSLVIPKAPARNILDVGPMVLADVINVTQRVAQASMAALNADGVTIQQFSERAGGQLVFHLHFHVMPRYDGIDLKPHAELLEDGGILAEHAALLRAFLRGARPA